MFLVICSQVTGYCDVCY